MKKNWNRVAWSVMVNLLFIAGATGQDTKLPHQGKPYLDRLQSVCADYLDANGKPLQQGAVIAQINTDLNIEAKVDQPSVVGYFAEDDHVVFFETIRSYRHYRHPVKPLGEITRQQLEDLLEKLPTDEPRFDAEAENPEGYITEFLDGLFAKDGTPIDVSARFIDENGYQVAVSFGGGDMFPQWHQQPPKSIEQGRAQIFELIYKTGDELQRIDETYELVDLANAERWMLIKTAEGLRRFVAEPWTVEPTTEGLRYTAKDGTIYDDEEAIFVSQVEADESKDGKWIWGNIGWRVYAAPVHLAPFADHAATAYAICDANWNIVQFWQTWNHGRGALDPTMQQRCEARVGNWHYPEVKNCHGAGFQGPPGLQGVKCSPYFWYCGLWSHLCHGEVMAQIKSLRWHKTVAWKCLDVSSACEHNSCDLWAPGCWTIGKNGVEWDD